MWVGVAVEGGGGGGRNEPHRKERTGRYCSFYLIGNPSLAFRSRVMNMLSLISLVSVCGLGKADLWNWAHCVDLQFCSRKSRLNRALMLTFTRARACVHAWLRACPTIGNECLFRFSTVQTNNPSKLKIPRACVAFNGRPIIT